MSTPSPLPSPAERPTWDAVWLHVAEAVSARSLCTRSKVGAVIVTPANRIVAVGYNNPPAGFRGGGGYRDELVKLIEDSFRHPETAVIQEPLTEAQLRAAGGHANQPCTEWCSRAKPPASWLTTEQTPNHTLITDSSGTYTESDIPFKGVQRRYLKTDEDWLALGYERVEELDPGYADCPSLHAEANALSVCDRSQREGGTIYVTSAVCFNCAKLVANSGLARVVVGASATEHAHRQPEASYEFLRSCGLTVDTDLW